MKQGIVKFSKEFVTPTGLKEWVGLEWNTDEPFDEAKAMETFMKVKEFVCNTQPSSKGVIDSYNNFVPPGPPTELPVINKAEERLGILIENATTKEELMGYKNDCSTVYLADLWATKLSTLNK